MRNRLPWLHNKRLYLFYQYRFPHQWYLAPLFCYFYNTVRLEKCINKPKRGRTVVELSGVGIFCEYCWDISEPNFALKTKLNAFYWTITYRYNLKQKNQKLRRDMETDNEILRINGKIQLLHEVGFCLK